MVGRTSELLARARTRARAAPNAPRARYRLALIALLVASLSAFGHVVEDYLTGDPIVRWDVSFASWLHEHSNPAVVIAFKVVTLAGNLVVLAPLAAVAVVLLWRRAARSDAFLVAAVAIGIEVLNGALKLLFHRPRPELSFVHLNTYSFPSGHAAGATAILGVLGVLAARHGLVRRRLALGVLLVLLVAAIDFSRLYLGAHYLSDVLAGSALGASWLAACLLVQELRLGQGEVVRV